MTKGGGSSPKSPPPSLPMPLSMPCLQQGQNLVLGFKLVHGSIGTAKFDLEQVQYVHSVAIEYRIAQIFEVENFNNLHGSDIDHESVTLQNIHYLKVTIVYGY
jgi:hypothetical protein